MEYTLIDNVAEQQFEFHLEDGEKALITYRIKDGVVYLLHTSIPEHFEGKGIASQLATKVFTRLKNNGISAKLYCAYLRTYVERHPEWESILVA